MSMGKYVSEDGLKRCLLIIKQYIDAVVEQNELITATALNELEGMINGIKTDMDTIDTISEKTIEELEEMVGNLHEDVVAESVEED